MKIRKAVGIALGLFGLAILSIPGTLLLWAHRQYTVGLSGNVTATMIGLTVAGLMCVFASYGIMRRRISNQNRADC
jgi:hypothetical protein